MYSTGRRKTSSARVFMNIGTGKILINKYKFKNYFKDKIKRLVIFYPFKIINDYSYIDKFDFYITVKGGGISSQVIAIRHGITRVLLKYNSNLRILLKNVGLITRDSREVERKKYGFRKSRCRPQYSKR